jgi:protein TonB
MILQERHWSIIYHYREQISYLFPLLICVISWLALNQLNKVSDLTSQPEFVAYLSNDPIVSSNPIQEKREKLTIPSKPDIQKFEEKSKSQSESKSKSTATENSTTSSSTAVQSNLQESSEKSSEASQSESTSAAGVRYEGLVLAALEKTKRYPTSREARERRSEGVVRVWLTLDRSGNLLDCGLLNSSGSNLLDNEAIRTAKRAVYPAFPNSVFPGESSHRFTTSLKFSINS